MRLTHAVATVSQIESRRAVLWLPVLLGLGIWIYFALAREPEVRTGSVWAVLLFVLVTCWRSGLWFRLPVIAALTVSLGYGLALWSAHRADAPQIRFPVGETVEGRVLEISRSASGAPRLPWLGQ